MRKQQEGRQTQLQITVLMRPEQDVGRAQDADWRAWCARICKELRAYLISR
jgi:hypothetical protein